MGVRAIELDFVVLTSEYPTYIGPNFNDVFVIWIESKRWTGNIALDAEGHALSVDAVTLEYMDDDSDLPQFEGTYMVGHGAT